MILAQDRALELAQLRSRLEAELFVEQPPALTEDVERVGLAPCAVERTHEQRPRPLLQRPLGHERLQLADELAAAAELQVRLDPLLESELTQLLEPRRLGLHERVVREVRERRVAPERKRNPESRRPCGRLLAPRSREQLLEEVQVELARPDAQHVPGSSGLEHVAGAPERLAQRGDVDLNRLRGGLRDLLRPKRLCEPVGRDDLVRMEEQEREQRALAGSAEIERAPGIEHLERPQNLELHGANATCSRKAFTRP